MTELAFLFALAPLALAVYCFVIYPLIVWQVSAGACGSVPDLSDAELPSVTVLIAAHNAGRALHDSLVSLVEDDYPAQLRTVIVISDGSRDDTPRIVREFRRNNVRMLQSRRRRGKTAAENLAAPFIDSGIVVCMDANARIERGAIRALVREFQRSDVGVVSGTDVMAECGSASGAGERAYIRAEMWLRRKESGWSGLVGVSGCLYAVRRALFTPDLRPFLTRDFAAVLLARKSGLRAIAVDGARCHLCTTDDSKVEYARKLRTMVHGLQTLTCFRELMNPLRYGRFACALISHKLCRWLVPLSVPTALLAIVYLSATELSPTVTWSAAVGAAVILSVIASRPAGLALMSYLVVVQLAALAAWLGFLRGKRVPLWKPTVRTPYTLRSLP